MTKTTNYYNTFIQIADDCPIKKAEIPPENKTKSAAYIAYELISNNPYEYTSDDVIYATSGLIKGISREDFFAKSHACLRTSALAKRYSWGIHSNANGEVAIYACESEEYRLLASDSSLKQLRAMRSKRV